METEKTSNVNEQKGLFGSLITEELDGNLVVIGYPHHEGAGRARKYKGQDNGPDCFRRFWKVIGPIKNCEYGVNMDNLRITDFGNIDPDPKKQPELCVLEKLGEVLTKVTVGALNKGGLPIVLGGTKELTASIILAHHNVSKGSKTIGLLSVNDCIDAHRPFDYGKIDQASYLRFIRQSEGLSKERFRYCGFGLLGEHISEEEISFLKEETEDAKLNYIRTIRTTGTPEVSQEDENAPLTQAGREFIKSLANLEDSCDIIHLSISLESIHSAFCPGVGNPAVVEGFTSEEIIEIALFAGRSKKVGSLDITGFNPSIEDFRTGRLMSSIVYFFSMGYSCRLGEIRRK